MTEFKETELDERAIKMAKVLSADAVEKAGSGHPGSPISLAPVAYTLYQHFIKHDPNDPNWEGRDRFILSGGHASLTVRPAVLLRLWPDPGRPQALPWWR